MHSIWDLWTSGLQECKGNFLGELDEVGSICQSGSSSLYYYYYYYYYWGRIARLWAPALTPLPHMMRSWLGQLGPVQMAWAPTLIVALADSVSQRSKSKAMDLEMWVYRCCNTQAIVKYTNGCSSLQLTYQSTYMGYKLSILCWVTNERLKVNKLLFFLQ